MFKIEDKELNTLKKNLNNISQTSFPIAVRSTLNKLAYNNFIEYKKNLNKELVFRGGQNNIVKKSVGYDKCLNTLDINVMEAFTGQRIKTFGKKTEQLRKQEYGETITAKSKHITKATKYTRGGNYKRLVPSERLISKMNLKGIKDLVNNVASTPEMQFKQAVAIAIKYNRTINFVPQKTNGYKFGIYQLRGTSSKNDAKLMYSFKDKNQKLTPKPMLKTATDKIVKNRSEIFKKEAERRIEKEISKGLS